MYLSRLFITTRLYGKAKAYTSLRADQRCLVVGFHTNTSSTENPGDYRRNMVPSISGRAGEGMFMDIPPGWSYFIISHRRLMRGYLPRIIDWIFTGDPRHNLSIFMQHFVFNWTPRGCACALTDRIGGIKNHTWCTIFPVGKRHFPTGTECHFLFGMTPLPVESWDFRTESDISSGMTSFLVGTWDCRTGSDPIGFRANRVQDTSV